jgi:DNA-binding CsgD family transcriptional regulator
MPVPIHPPESITPQFYSDAPEITGNDSIDALPFGIYDFSSICIEAVYVIDFLKQNFQFVGQHDFFLCGYTVTEAMALGYDFYTRIVHPKDLPLLVNMHNAILNRLQSLDHPEAINYFSFFIRLKSGTKHLMAYHKLKPVFVDGQLRYGICILASSVLQRPGHLCAYYFDNTAFDEYKPSRDKWIRHKIKKLSAREQDVLQLAKQGKLHKEIADALEISPNSVRNTLASLYLKFSINGMMQAVVYATNHRLLFTAKKCSTYQELGLPPEYKRTRTLISDEMLLRIQKRRDNGESVNSIARHEGVTEGAIRYALRKP